VIFHAMLQLMNYYDIVIKGKIEVKK
jgi:hypothetical protein